MTSGGDDDGGRPRERNRGWPDRLVRQFGRLVPEHRRSDWIREWQAELDVAGTGAARRDRAWRMATRLAAAAEDAIRFRTRHRFQLSGMEWLREARLATRALVRTPQFSATVVLTLAVGVGANAALFAVINAALLEPLPYPSSDRIVVVGTMWPAEGSSTRFVSTADFDDFAERIRSVEEPAFRVAGGVTYQTDEPIRLAIASVSSSFFRLFGTRPHIGRYLRSDEDVPGAAAAVLSYAFWQRVFGGDPGVVNRTLTLDGQPYVVVGVAESGLRDPSADVDLWTSRPRWIDVAQRDQPWLEVFGRLSHGNSLDDAHAEAAMLSRDLAREYPATNEGHVLTADSLREAISGPVRAALLVLGGVVILVLAITCANVANLVLIRSAGRGREMAVRLSLGARRSRLARQLITEGLILALAGGLAGLALAAGATRAFVALGAPGLPRLADVRLDGTVLLFTLVLSGATGIVFGLAPLLQVSRSTPADEMRESGRGGETRRVKRVRRALVVAELAGAAMLLVGAGLLVRSLVHLTRTDTGVRADGVLTFHVAPPQVRSLSATGATESRWQTRAELRDFYDRILQGIARLPGVEAAGGINILPVTGSQLYGVTRDDRPPQPGEPAMADIRIVEPGYFASVGIRHTTGRALDERDTGGAPPAVAIDEEFARTVFPGEDPIGRRITIEWSGGVESVSYEIVAVVGSVRHRGPTLPPSPTVYLHRGHDSSPYWMHFAHAITVRTRGDPLALARAARNVVWSIDRTVPITEIGPLDRILDRHVAGARYRMLLIAAFAAVATLLAAVGIGGIVAYAVAQRGRELGIRQALGAAPAEVVRLVLGEGVRLAALGVTAGLVLATFGSRLLRSFLFGVDPADPLTFGAVAVTLAAIALTSAWIPARRATRVRPADALRGEG
ncbi:MAG: ABC transporter permease [Gemmatimonadetes bacterium]|nr:ABC transporter permease [Gemmatimonadota bacterium]